MQKLTRFLKLTLVVLREVFYVFALLGLLKGGITGLSVLHSMRV